MMTQSGGTTNRVPLAAFLGGSLLLGLLAATMSITASFFMEDQPLPELPERPFIREQPAEEAEAALPRMEFFQDVTAQSGVGFTYHNGEEAGHCTLLESLGGGVALFDFDGDGLLDLFLIGGGSFAGEDQREIRGYPCKLYRNLGNWKFQDVTGQAGLDQCCFYAHGCAVADYDCDGWPDLLVTGYGRLALFHNEGNGQGGRRFVEVTEAAGLHDPLWSTSAAWADLDGDGYPDLYVCHYVDWSWEKHRVCGGDAASVARDVCPPKHFLGVAHALYRNNGDGTFRDVSKEAGIRQGPADAGMGLGVVAVDVNDDRRPDIYAVNDTTRNFLYVNQSSPGKLRFLEIGLESGTAMGETARPDGSMGVDAGDYDGCGRPSLWVTNFEQERHALYHNESNEKRILFRHVTRQAGIAALGTVFVGFGTGFIDLDNDGWEDLVIANGHVRRYPTHAPVQQRAVLLRNQGTGRFVIRTSQGGAYFQALHRGRGLAVGDLDNDGRPDLVITHLNEPVALLRNDSNGKEAPRHHWLGIELLGRKNRDIVGAKVVVEVGGRRLTRFAKGGGSYLSSGDRRIIVGLGEAERCDRVIVSWPWGEEQQWEGLTSDRYWRLVEGEPEAREPGAQR
jgi:enediyne biosynthesis protein E4